MNDRWKSALPAALSAVLLAGCARPAPEASDVSQVSSSGVEVEEHWSVLGDTQRLPAVGTRWQEGPMEELVPRVDYGELVPYAGAGYYLMFPGEDGQSVQDSYLSYLYGLMTVDGCVVLDPVCTSIYSVTYEDQRGWIQTLPVWELLSAAPESGNPVNGRLIALAAQDGSWVTEFRYWVAAGSPEGIFAGNEEGVYLLDCDTGAEQKFWTWSQLGVEDLNNFPWFASDMETSAKWVGDMFYLGSWGEERSARLINLETGEVITMSDSEWYEKESARYNNYTIQEEWRVESGEDGTVTVTKENTIYTFPSPLPEDQYPYARLDRVIFQSYSENRYQFAVTTLEGQTILPAQEGRLTVLEGKDSRYLAVQPAEVSDWILYSWDGEPGPTLPGGAYRWCDLSGPLVEVRSGDNAAYYRPDTGECVFRAWFTLEDRTEGLGSEEDG